MNVTSAAQKIQLKEEGHVLTKKYIDTLKLNLGTKNCYYEWNRQFFKNRK